MPCESGVKRGQWKVKGVCLCMCVEYQWVLVEKQIPTTHCVSCNW